MRGPSYKEAPLRISLALVAGSVQRYVENYTEQLESANAKLLFANENLSQGDESRLRLMRTVTHEIANVLNALTVSVSLITTSNEEASRSEMLDSSIFLMMDILRDADVL